MDLVFKRSVSGVVLITPYDSIKNVAQALYPYVPVGLLLKYNFDSLVKAPSIKVPMLALIAENDTIIPTENSERLIRAWGGQVTKKVIRGKGHNSVSFGKGYHASINDFISK